MYSRKGIQAYQETNITTADPKRLVLMCYEGALDYLRIGKEKIVEKDYDGKTKALTKVQDIINELMCSLDFEKGGPIARNLESLYNFLLRNVLQADLKNDVRTLDQVIGILDELKSAWEQIGRKPGKKVQAEIPGVEEESFQAASYAAL